MKNKGQVSIIFILIVILASIILVFTIPTFSFLSDNMKTSRINNSKIGIINSAKSKFGANINDLSSDGVYEYTVSELIKEGYFKGEEINPITNKKYNENDKVLIIVKNGNITYKYVSGDLLINSIKKSENIQKVDKEYYYKSDSDNNYINFNEDIYRIIKIDSSNNIVIIKDDLDKSISVDEIDSYLDTYYNDEIKTDYKKLVKGNIELLSLKDYNNTIIDGKTFLNKNYNTWIKDESYRLIDFNNNMIDGKKGWIRPVIKINYDLIIEKGDGSRINPYSIKF